MKKLFQKRTVIGLLVVVLAAFIVVKSIKVFFEPYFKKSPVETESPPSYPETPQDWAPHENNLSHNESALLDNESALLHNESALLHNKDAVLHNESAVLYNEKKYTRDERCTEPKFRKVDNKTKIRCLESSNKATGGYKPFCFYPEGWSFDVGGQFTWMELPPFNFLGNSAYSGNEIGWGGGFTGKITYQQPQEVFAQLRATYNSMDTNINNKIDEAYAELVAGYCFSMAPCLSLTPYMGVGCDNLQDSNTAYFTEDPVYIVLSDQKPSYQTYYGVIGFDTHYAWEKCKLGAQFDFYFPFQQQLDLVRYNCSLDKNVGFATRLPIARRLTQHIWLELTPYYRFFVLGSGLKGTYALDRRNMNQAGAFLTLKVFL